MNQSKTIKIESIEQANINANQIQTYQQTSHNWKELLKTEFEQKYYQQLRATIQEKRAHGTTIYPADNEIFKALSLTPFNQIKVVILGQDPYHGPDQAHGLCFSVNPGIKPPPSLVNIFKELNADLEIPIPNHGNLRSWAKQGVLLLNTVLTVEARTAGSHQGLGWERFTDSIISLINEQLSGVVFLLWGAKAQTKGEIIDPSRHRVLKAPHPSPFSVHRGFFGCKHFSETNQILIEQGKEPINWEPKVDA